MSPAELLRQVRLLSLGLGGAPLAVRDRASLIEIQALLDVGLIADADKLAQGMLTEPARSSSPLAMVRARLALLRVRLRQSNIRDSAQLAHDILASRPVFENDALSPELFAATATALNRNGEYEPATRLFIDAINAADRFDRKDQKAYALIGLCALNHDLQNNTKALEYCQQGAQIADQTGNKMARAAAAINLALSYETANDAKDQLIELEKSLALAQQMGLKRAEGMAHINLADYAMTRNDWKTGLQHCREGLRIGRELSDPTMIAVSLTNLGTATSQLGDTNAGIKLYEQGIKEVEDAGDTAYVVDFLSGLADLYEKAGRTSDALKAMRRRVDEGDKLYQKTQADAIAALQSKYDADRRQREITVLTLDNQLKSVALDRRALQVRTYWLAGALLVLLSIVLVFAYERVRKANRVLSSQNLELELHSLCDPLTGLFNRRALKSFLDLRNPIDRPPRHPPPPMAFVLADVDHFKRINDTWGHSYGDAVLVELSRRLTRLVRPDDRIFRLGGEEFLLLLSDISNADLSHLCRRILATVNSEPVVADDQSIPLTISLGACRFPLIDQIPFAQDWQRHQHLADLALYRSKATGRNRAHQIVSIIDASEATLERIEIDFAAAQAAHLIEVVVIEGGESPPAVAIRETAGSAVLS